MMAGNPAHVAVVGKIEVILLYCRSDALRQPGFQATADQSL